MRAVLDGEANKLPRLELDLAVVRQNLAVQHPDRAGCKVSEDAYVRAGTAARVELALGLHIERRIVALNRRECESGVGGILPI